MQGELCEYWLLPSSSLICSGHIGLFHSHDCAMFFGAWSLHTYFSLFLLFPSSLSLILQCSLYYYHVREAFLACLLRSFQGPLCISVPRHLIGFFRMLVTICNRACELSNFYWFIIFLPVPQISKVHKGRGSICRVYCVPSVSSRDPNTQQM
jgi:hypothetical protein